MDLKVFNKENCSYVYFQNPTITINRKGSIGLSGRFSLLTGIYPYDKVAFYQDKKTYEWFVALDPKGFQIKQYSDKLLQINNKYLCNKIMDDLKIPFEVNYCKMMVSPEPVKEGDKTYFPLITKSVKYKLPEKESK